MTDCNNHPRTASDLVKSVQREVAASTWRLKCQQSANETMAWITNDGSMTNKMNAWNKGGSIAGNNQYKDGRASNATIAV